MLLRSISLAGLLFSPLTTAAADVVELSPVQDATLYESSSANQLASGSGPTLFAGRTNSQGGASLRRTLIGFDLTEVPPGSTITSVELRMFVSNAPNDFPVPNTLRRMLVTWGEGASDAGISGGPGVPAQGGDATWFSRFFPIQAWATPGGDFSNTVSATQAVPTAGPFAFASTPQMVADVQAWVDGTLPNHGWMVRGVEDAQNQARRFSSRESAEVAQRPVLVVEFDPPGCPVSVAASQTVRLGVPANPNAFLPSPSLPVIGTLWTPSIDHTTFVPNALLDFVALSTTSFNIPLPPVGTALVNPATQALQVVTVGQPFALAVPDNCDLAGVPLFTQGGSVDAIGQVALANGLDLVIGT